MKERISRKHDQKLYQPKVHSDRIRELYKLKLATGLPMTVLLDRAIKDYLDKSEKEHTETGKNTGQGVL